MSSPTRWLRVRELFDLAMEQPTESRAAWVRQAAGSESALGDEVLSLLSALDHARDTLERPAEGVLAAVFMDGEDASMVGRRVGSWDIVRLIGVGGMGAVYEGVRAEGDFAKRVAIKFLRPELGSDLAIRRFRYERQILASLNHRNIAGLYDGGVTQDGLQYFVMEYVDGIPITSYCTQHRLPIRERVGLFRQVCTAVQHAHQQLIVHRDLKPGNILVTGDGTVKLLDFGIAKLLREEEGPDQLPMTRGGMRVFTPEYASPEQVRGLPMAAASDIYSLGVVLFELVSGRRPFSTEGKLFAEIERDICSVAAPAPSSVVTGSASAMGERSVQRLRRRLTGDLDAVTLTALAKEPARRYGTADQFNDDLRRWTEGRPVTAQKAWLGYRFRKFVARHRFEVAAGSLAVVALVGGIVATSRQARIARVEQLKAEQVNSFMSTMLSAVDPGYEGRDVTVAQVLNKAARDVETRQLNPEVEAQIRHTIGQTYYGLGYYDSATTHAQKAFELRRRVFGDRDLRTAISLSYVVALAEARGAYVEAESLARVNVGMHRRLPKLDQGELATALDNLARTIEHQGRLDEAMTIKLEAIGIRRTYSDSASLSHLPYSLNNLAVSYMYHENYAKAESLMTEALEVEGRLHGKESPNYGDLLRGLASLYDEMVGRKAESDSAIRESVRILKMTLGDDHTNYLRSRSMYATLRYTAGDMAEAVAAASEVSAKIGGALHEGDQTSSSVLQVLGLALDSLGRFEEGGVALRRSLEIRRKYLPKDHWAIASSEAVVGYHLTKVKRFDEGEKLLIASYHKLAKSRGADAQVTKRVAVRLVEMYTLLGRTADAERWKARG